MDGDFARWLSSFLEAVLLEARAAADYARDRLIEIFFLPGDYLLAQLLATAPATADSLGIGAADRHLAVLLSAMVWLVSLLLLRQVWKLLETLSWSARRLARAAAHRLRMFRWRMSFPAPRREPSLGTELDELHIDEVQAAILQAQSRLPPGYAMTALDVASELGVRPARAQQALDDLKKLELVEVSFATTDGFPGYLLARRPRPPAAGAAR